MNLLKRIVPWLPIGCVAAATGLVGYAWASIAAIDNRPWASVALEAVGAMAPVLCIGGAVLLVVSSCALCKLKKDVLAEERDEAEPKKPRQPLLSSEAAAIECVSGDCGFLLVLHLPEGPVTCRLTSIVETMPKRDAIRLLQWALPAPYNKVLDINSSGTPIVQL